NQQVSLLKIVFENDISTNFFKILLYKGDVLIGCLNALIDRENFLLNCKKEFAMKNSKTPIKNSPQPRWRIDVMCYLTAKVISASQATSPSTVATPFPLPTGPFNRMISTSNCS